MRGFKVHDQLINLLYVKSQLAVKIETTLGDWFRAEIESRQSDPVSALVFIIELERVMEPNECSMVAHRKHVHGELITDIRCGFTK